MVYGLSNIFINPSLRLLELMRLAISGLLYGETNEVIGFSKVIQHKVDDVLPVEYLNAVFPPSAPASDESLVASESSEQSVSAVAI